MEQKVDSHKVKGKLGVQAEKIEKIIDEFK